MRRGFTLLEMLVATALTAVLLAAVFQVIGTLGRSRAALARPADHSEWKTDLLDMLRRDLMNSTAMDVHNNSVVLTGHFALDRNTLAVAHEPVQVTYAVASIHGRNWLVRMQSPRGSANEPAWTELICADVNGFDVKSASVIAPDQVDGAVVPPVVWVRVDGPVGVGIGETLVVR